MISTHVRFFAENPDIIGAVALLLAALGLGYIWGAAMAYTERARFFKWMDKEVPWSDLNVCTACRTSGAPRLVDSGQSNPSAQPLAAARNDSREPGLTPALRRDVVGGFHKAGGAW